MSLRKFLEEQGFLEKKQESVQSNAKTKEQSPTSPSPPKQVVPTYFPTAGHATTMPIATPIPAVSGLPSTSVVPDSNKQQPVVSINPAFIKYYEDAMIALNLEGMDYFEFRQQLLTMLKKMGAQKTFSMELVIQTVVMHFETHSVSVTKLIEAARYYAQQLALKRDEFVNGGANEKDKLLKQRVTTEQHHLTTIGNLEKQIQDLQEKLMQERTQMELDKTLGQEAITKIDEAIDQMKLAFDHMNMQISNDITNLQKIPVT